MSSDDSYDDEEEREHDRRRREKRRAIKPWHRRAMNWCEAEGGATAKELLEICTFYAGLSENDRDIQLYDALDYHGYRISADDMATMLDWFHKDPEKRKVLNTLLCVYRHNYDPTEMGPEKHLVRHWWKLDAAQRTAIKEHGKVDAVKVWSMLYGDGDSWCGEARAPEGMCWEFLDDIEVLIKKYNK